MDELMLYLCFITLGALLLTCISYRNEGGLREAFMPAEKDED